MKSASQTRSEAVTSFKTQNATKYTTQFTVEPTVRPSYVPTYYTDGGIHRTVYYDYHYGGYGYWNAMNQFIIYDALTQAANQHATQVVYNTYNNDGSVETTSGGSTFLIVLVVIVAIVVIGGIVFAVTID